MAHLLCLGFGYTAQALVRHLAASPQADRWRFSGSSREPVVEWGAPGGLPSVELLHFDGGTPAEPLRAAIRGASHILHAVPPAVGGDPVFAALATDLAAANLDWFGYLSTSGVYGDQQGGWVDESSPRNPAGPRGEMRLRAEQDWLSLWHSQALPVHLFRLAGIYGPGRNQLASLKAGTARRMVKKHQVFSRIHVDDIAQVLAASMARPNPGAAYNVCDDEAAPPQDVVTFAANLLGQAPPPEIDFETADLSPMARSFYGENKRLRNDRIKTELGVNLRYPSYREGLRDLLSEFKS